MNPIKRLYAFFRLVYYRKRYERLFLLYSRLGNDPEEASNKAVEAFGLIYGILYHDLFFELHGWPERIGRHQSGWYFEEYVWKTRRAAS